MLFDFRCLEFPPAPLCKRGVISILPLLFAKVVDFNFPPPFAKGGIKGGFCVIDKPRLECFRDGAIV